MKIIVVDDKDAESRFGPFISSDTARSFHRPGCKWLRNILKRNRITYSSHVAAVEAGKKTCKSCNS
jgi:methylphosphotriester-DNA--protein-cysteine methyltransferase